MCWAEKKVGVVGFLFVCWKVIYSCVERFCICVFQGSVFRHWHIYICFLKGFVFVSWKVLYSCVQRFFICVLKGVHFKGGPVDHVLPLLKCTEFATAQSIKLQLLHEVNKVKPDIWFHCQPSIAGQGWQRRPSLCKCIVKNSWSGFFIGQQSWWSPQQYFKPSFLSVPSPIITLPFK